MVIIQNVNTTRFAINDTKYLKNYLSCPYGDKIEIFNCYERQDVLVPQTHYSQFTINGNTYNSAAEVQNALLDILFYRSSLSGGGSGTGMGVREVKTITTATNGFATNTYTLQAGDETKWLSFNIATNYNIKLPAGIFAANTEFEGETIGNGQGTFTTATGISLFYAAGDLPKTAERNSVFGIKYRTVNNVIVFGRLEVL